MQKIKFQKLFNMRFFRKLELIYFKLFFIFKLIEITHQQHEAKVATATSTQTAT